MAAWCLPITCLVDEPVTRCGTTDPGLSRLVDGVLLPGFTGVSVPDWLGERLARGLAGVCLGDGNVGGRAQLTALSADLHALRDDLLVALDGEDGAPAGLRPGPGSPFPSPDDARACGIDLLLGPGGVRLHRDRDLGGVVVSDALDKAPGGIGAAAVHALARGADLLRVGDPTGSWTVDGRTGRVVDGEDVRQLAEVRAALLAALDAGLLSRGRLEAAGARVDALRTRCRDRRRSRFVVRPGGAAIGATGATGTVGAIGADRSRVTADALSAAR